MTTTHKREAVNVEDLDATLRAIRERLHLRSYNSAHVQANKDIDTLLSIIDGLMALVETGDELYSAMAALRIVMRPQAFAERQAEAMADYAKASNAYRAIVSNGEG